MNSSYYIHPIYVINERMLGADFTSEEWRANLYGNFSIEIIANRERIEVVQDLVGVLYLRHRNVLTGEMEVIDDVEIDAVAGTEYHYCQSFSGGHAGFYDLFFDYTSGDGDLIAAVTIPNGIR